MKDLSLSLLSRGCGFVSSGRNAGRRDGRLDVCYTPQDYYIWKSQHTLLQVSNRGRLLAETQSTLPKTYSTRRGPLLLFSQYLVSLGTPCHSEVRDRKRRVVQRYAQQVDQQARTVKKLKAAVLNKKHTQFDPPLFPPRHPRFASDLHRHSPTLTTREQNTEPPENQPKEKKEELSNRKRIRLDLFLQIQRTSRTPSPGIQPQPCVQHVAMTPEEETQIYLDASLQYTGTEHHSMDGEPNHPNIICVHDPADNQGCSFRGSQKTKGDCERSMNADRRRKAGLLPPLTVGQPVCNEPCSEKTNWLKWERPSSDERHLPPRAGSCTVVPGWAQGQKDTQTKAERGGFQTRHNAFLPQLFPEKDEEITGKQRGDQTERQNLKKGSMGQGGGGRGRGRGRLLPERGSLMLLEPEEEPSPPLGLLGCVTGRKGPGKQSSLAFLQNRPDPQDPSEADSIRVVVRGILPLELRDLQDSKSVGSLILSPDGEIIQLSLYDSSQDPSRSERDTQKRALQVLSAEGEKLPWVVVLQAEHAETEGGVERNINGSLGDVLHHQHNHQLLDLHRQPESFSTSSHTDAVSPAGTRKNTKSAEAGVKSPETPKTDSKSDVRPHPKRERAGKEEPGGGDTDAEEENEDQTVSGSRHPGEELPFIGDISSSDHSDINEAAAHDAADEKRKKWKTDEEASIAQRRRDVKAGRRAESDGQKIDGRARKDVWWQRGQTGGDTQSARRPEERTTRGAPETRDQSALHSVEKKRTDSDGAGGKEMLHEEKDERGEAVRQKKESAERRKRRRRRLKRKESVTAGNRDVEEVEINQQTDEEPHLKSASGAPGSSKAITPDPGEDSEHLSIDGDGSVRSVSSLGWAAAQPPASREGLASSHGRRSSCSTVRITEEQLMLNPVRPESCAEEAEKAVALHLAQRAERRRQEVERKRREREEEERKQQERQQTEERMGSELEEERKRRAEELRLKKLAEEEERNKREEEERERARQEQAQRERKQRRQKERRRQIERLQRMREEEELRRKAEVEHLHLEEERRQEEERNKLQEMEESESIEYLRRKEQEEEDRGSREEERRKIEEEATVQAAELLARQMALLQQQLAFNRGLLLEAGGLEKTQSISRPWVYSYFTLLQLLGLSPAPAETVSR